MEDTYAVAVVVGREAPVSSHLGDRAVVRADGRMEGFIGGACSRDIIRAQALQALRAGEPRLVRIRPNAREIREERDAVTVPMGCVSEGAVDVFIEPHLPKRELLVAGITPVARALAQIAPALDFFVVRFVQEQELREVEKFDDSVVLPIDSLDEYLQRLDSQSRERCVGIAASQGHYDERALTSFAKNGVGFIGLLASPKRAASIAEALLQEGVSPERARTIHNPVGLAIGARKPAEVAVSILAEVVSSAAKQAAATAADTATDPVCGMRVEIATALHHADIDGRTYYFCSPHCRASFAAHPERFLAAATP